MADEIIARYRLETNQFVAGAQVIEAETDKLVGDNKKLETSFNQVNKSTSKAFTTDAVKNFNKEAGKALKDVKKETDNLTKSSTNGFLAMRKELKSVQGELAILQSKGRENSKLFKALSADAGQLKDRMKDLGDSINLQANSPLENFSGSLGNAKNALLNLDLEGATRAFGVAGAQIGKINFKDLTAQIGQAAGGIVKLGASILSSPLFLIAGAVTGIVYAISQWGDSLEEIQAKNDRIISGIERQSKLTQAGYEAQIILARAAGKATEELQKDQLRDTINTIETTLKLRQKELAFQESAAQKIAIFLGKKRAESIVDTTKTNDVLADLEAELITTKAELSAVDVATNKAAEDKKLEDARKANEAHKKLLEERLQNGIKKFNEAVDRERFEEQQKEKEELEASNKKIDEIINSNYEKRKTDRQTLDDDLREIRRKGLDQQLEDERLSFEERQAALNEAHEKELISDQEFTDMSLELTNERIEAKRAEFNAAVQLGNDLISIADNFLQIARNQGMENAEAEKAIAVFGVAMNLAQSLGNMILGATTAAAATGPLAPITLIGYIASGTAAVLGAFAQISAILNQEPPSFAEGGYTGSGGKYQAAGTVHKGEFVNTQEDTRKYWDELNAIHDGTFEDLLYYKHIEPALNQAMMEAKEGQSLSFAQNIGNSMRLNFKSNEMLNALMKGNTDENKRHNQLINTIKKTGNKRIYRKK